MIRTNEEWYEYAMKRGTSGDMVFDILNDWQEDHDKLQKIIDDNQDAAVLEFQRKAESKGDIVGLGRFKQNPLAEVEDDGGW